MEWILENACCQPAERAKKLSFGISISMTAALPVTDFVTDLIATHGFLTSDDPHRIAWGYVSCGILGVCTLVNLVIFWYEDLHSIWDGNLIWAPCSDALNVFIGLLLTATNCRAQGAACIVLFKLIYRGKSVEELTATRIGNADAQSIALINLFEYMFESTPELLLQNYAVLFGSYVDNEPAASDKALLVSMAAGFATLVDGLYSTFLGGNPGLAVKALGTAYLFCIVVARFAVIVLVFLSFGVYGAIFVAASFILRCGVVGCEHRADYSRVAAILLESPFIFVMPVGRPIDEDGDQAPRAMGHALGGKGVLVDTILFSRTALAILALHVAEAGVAVALLLAVPGRRIAPYVPDDPDVAAIEIAVPPVDVLYFSG